MSGDTNEDQRRRYNEMVQKVNSNSSSFNGNVPAVAMSSASTLAPSEGSVFKLPTTIKKRLLWERLDSRIDVINRCFRYDENVDEFFLKMWVRSSELILKLSGQQLLGSFDAAAIIDMVAENLKTKFYNGRVPRAMSSVSQSSDIPPFESSRNDNPSMMLDRTTSSYQPQMLGINDNPYVYVERLMSSHQPQIPGRTDNPSLMMDRTTSSYQPQMLGRNDNPSMMSDRTTSSYHPQMLARNDNPSMMLDRTTSSYQPQMLARNDNPSMMLDRTTSSHQPQVLARNDNPSMMLDRTTSSYQPQMLARNDNPSMMLDRTASSYQPQMLAQNNKVLSMRQARTPPRHQSSENQSLQKNKTKQPQKKTSDQNVMDKTRNVTMNKATEKNRPGQKEHLKGSRPVQHQGLDITGNISVVGSNGVTRSGRQVKAPNPFWRKFDSTLNGPPSVIDYHSRKQDLSSKDSPAQDLNDTLSLRNKVVVRNTPLTKKKNGSGTCTPMSTISEQELEPKMKKKGRPVRVAKRKSVNTENKENRLAEQMAGSVSNQEAKRLDKKLVKPKSKVVKKAPAKRKSKEAELTLSKRKKAEELLSDSHNSNYDSEEIFEEIFTKKRPQTVNQILSPSNGLHSVKKAAAAATSKETPPAKFLSQIMGPASVTASAAKEPPESTVSQVVKRVIKKVEKKAPKKCGKKNGPAKDDKKEDPMVNEIINELVKSTYNTTPSGTVTVFRGTEPASDLESELSDDDDDLF